MTSPLDAPVLAIDADHGALSDNSPGSTDEEAPSSILIVDDLQEKLLVYGAVLEELGHPLVFVRSGSDALREVLRHEFAVILLDVNMPDIDGFETALMIRKYRKSAHTPIIFQTAYADDIQMARGYALGAVDFVLSPVVPDVLRTKVKVFADLFDMRRRVRRQGNERAARLVAETARLAAERSDRRSHFLAQASQALQASLDPDVVEQQLLRLVVPELGVAAWFLRVGERGELAGGLGCRACDGAAGPLQRMPADALPGPVAAIAGRSLGHGGALPLGAADAAACDAALPAGSAAAGAPGPSVAASLTSGSRRIGVLWVSQPAPAQPGEPDWSLIGELAGRAAVAIENARLYHTLQAENAVRRNAEQQLQQASQRKDEFLAMLSHELRNPLAPIRTAIELVRRIGPENPKIVWAVDIMDRQVRHMTKLIEELLDLARISEGKITLTRAPVDLRAVLVASAETTEPLLQAQGNVLRMDLPDTPVWLQGDQGRLVQVVSNLLNNAVKYGGPNGHTHLSLSVHLGEALISVRDGGIGIERELLPQIFELFTQGERSLDRSQGGLGVGLTLVRRLVELHGGRVEALSDGIGRGSEFRVHLPVMSVVATPASDADAQRPAGRAVGLQRILIVDDNHDAADSIAVLLKLEGHEVRIVNDGPQALASIDSFAPQVIVLDIGLPGMSGYDVARRVRAQGASQDALLIAVTGYGQKDDREVALAAGFDVHLVKPADPCEIEALIAQRFSAHAGPAPAGAAS